MSKYFLPTYVEKALYALCKETASPVSDDVVKHVRNGAWSDLVSMTVNPRNYTDPHAYKKDAAVVGLLRKTEGIPTGIDKRAAAVVNFWKGEHSCLRTNLRLERFLHSFDLNDQDEQVLIHIRGIRKIIGDILGPLPAYVEGKFGPGATYGDRGSLTTIPDKMSSHPSMTAGVNPFLYFWNETLWATACRASARIPFMVLGNRFTTVPKDSLKDRGICIEPSLNLFYQLAFGNLIRRRLKRAGIDLRKAQEIHRRVACDASITGLFATLDLSNASDTVALALVKLLLPTAWFECLEALRSERTQLDGKWVKLEKFSSMGNGYTFELETLLFLAISLYASRQTNANAKVGEDVHVYGDDIIVATEAAPNVIALLRFFGFDLNEAKSFVTGPFRESCGGDYFFGQAVRPYHIKELPYEPQHYIAIANGIRRLGNHDAESNDLSSWYLRAWFCILDAIPSTIRRCRGPEGLGDIVIHDREINWSIRTRWSIRYIQCYRIHRTTRVAWDHFRPEVVLASACYGIGDGRKKFTPKGEEQIVYDAGGVIPRNPIVSYKTGWVTFS